MKVGFALPTVDARSGLPTTLAHVAGQAQRAEQAGFDSIWVMDHFWTERPTGRRGSHEPMVTLGYLAAQTSRLRLGTLVLCNSFRHPGQLGREALALADASQGRFVLGLGAGWHRPEYDAFGIPFDHRVSRLEETLTVLPPLLRGDRVTHEGRYLRLREASLVGATEPPPIWLAGAGPRILDLTARYAAGWNVAWYGEDPGDFSAAVRDLHSALAATGRAVSDIEVSVGVFVVPGSVAQTQPGEAIAGEPEQVAERLIAYGEAGADLVIVSLALSPFAELEPSYLEQMTSVLRRIPGG